VYALVVNIISKPDGLATPELFIVDIIATPVLPSQRQLGQRTHWCVPAQHRVCQFEQRIGACGQTAMELGPEPSQTPESPHRIDVRHTDHQTALGSVFFPRQEE
jgi:hypothetical protein